jgi:two-component system, NtrC family, sensor kinase
MAMLGQFVAGIAHEVNTPLGTLIANDDTVKRCLEQIEVKDDKGNKYRVTAMELLKINQMASERIMEIVRNLRNFARLDESDLKQVDLHEGIDSTLLLIRSSIKPEIRIIKQYGDIPPIQCFPGLLNQVFMNLLINASHSIDERGTITIETRYKPGEQQVEIAIHDTGKGIAPENLTKIFDPGFTTKGVGVGTGLGLALCYKIMEKHRGRVLVDSVVGEGTTMTVVLPVKQTKIAGPHLEIVEKDEPESQPMP